MSEHKEAQRKRSAARAIAPTVASAAIIIAAIVFVYYTTRNTVPEQADSGGHDHAAMLAGGTGTEAHPVTLTHDQARRIGVTYAQVESGPLSREVRTVGQITFDETRLHSISPRIEGWVEQLFVNSTGQAVSAGQPLLTIYSPILVQAQEELLLSKRLRSSLADADSLARANADALIQSARQKLELLDIPRSEIAALEQSGNIKRALTLFSPIGGYVLEKNLLAGQKIMAGEALYRVADLSTVWMEGEVFEQDLADIKLGETVHADFPALPGEHRMGKVSYIYPVISTETRTARIRVVLPNNDLHLKPGMYATIRIVGTVRPHALTVPRDAVLSTGDRHVVFVRDSNGTLSPREIAIGTSNNERIEILRGLSEGETVVASATFLVDAESNLGKALGGMGDMPGMDMNSPIEKLPMQETGKGVRQQTKRDSATRAQDPHAGHRMP